MLRGVEGPMFAVASKAIAGAVLLQCFVDIGSKAFGVGDLIRGEAGIVFRKIKKVQLILPPDRRGPQDEFRLMSGKDR